MTITLQESIAANQSMVLVDNPDETSLDDYLQIDDEFVVVRGKPSESGLLVGRGVLGSTRATHAAGALVTQAAIGGTPAFSGCRYQVSRADGSRIQATGISLAIYITNAFPFYDTDAYAPDGFALDNTYNGFEFVIPADGYYRIGVNVRVDWTDSDATYGEIVIASSDRDNEWDTFDHLSVAPAEAPVGRDVEAHTSVTHWLAAGDNLNVNWSNDASGNATAPFLTAAIEIAFVGSGTNPVS